MIWDNDAVTMLKMLWRRGDAISEIGRLMGISKNAVVGKAHRLDDLDARQTPIRRGGVAVIASSDPVRALPLPQPLPPLASLQDPLPSFQTLTPVPVRPRPILPPEPPSLPRGDNPAGPLPMPIGVRTLGAPAILPAPLPRPIVRRTTAECCWPIGHVGTKEFRFCATPSVWGKPYCDDHSKLAYVKIRDKKVDVT